MEEAYSVYQEALKSYQEILKKWGGSLFADEVWEAWNKVNAAWDQYMLRCEESEHAGI